MSIEIPNKLHAACTFNAVNPPTIVRGDGINAVTRTGVGTYTLRLDTEPGGVRSVGAAATTALDWVISTNILQNAPLSAIVAVQAVVSAADPRDVLVTLLNAAGAAADNAQIQLMLWRLPTTG